MTTPPLSETEAKEVLELAQQHGLGRINHNGKWLTSAIPGIAADQIIAFAAAMKKRGAEEMQRMAVLKCEWYAETTVHDAFRVAAQMCSDIIRNLKVGE